jgi:hypothetical protein
MIGNKSDDCYRWAEAIMTVRFDLEEGQLVDYVCPGDIFPEKLKKIIGYFSFPDSYVFSPEGELFYAFQLKFENEPLYCYSHFTQKKDPTNPRGYFQKSIVLVSKVRLIKIFKVVLKEINRLYFTANLEDVILRRCLESLNSNPNPAFVVKANEKFVVRLFENDIKVLT